MKQQDAAMGDEMPKYRSLSHEFWDDASVGELDHVERLLLIGIITRLCDDYGRFRCEPKTIRKILFGFDDNVTSEKISSGLHRITELFPTFRKYTVQGCLYVEVVNYDKYQQIRYKAKSTLPSFSEATENTEDITDAAEIAENCGKFPKIAENYRSVVLCSVENRTCATDDARDIPLPVSTEPKHSQSRLEQQQNIWFEEFWSGFWKKRGRKNAFKVFCRYVKTTESFEQIMAGMRRDRPEMLGREDGHRKMAEGWINSEVWREETVETKPPSKTFEERLAESMATDSRPMWEDPPVRRIN